MQQPHTTFRHPAGRGHTLIEMVTALAVVGILLLAAASAMLVASRAVDPDSPLRTTHAAAEAAARLAQELQVAEAFSERQSTSVAFTVADRDADGSAETIRYAWSGTAGDPLTRACNGGTAVTVIQDVHDFHLGYEVKSETEQPDATRNESGETLLASHTTAEEPDNFAVKENKWPGQYFKPTLPADAVSWAVTRVLLKARIHGADKGVAGVQLRLPDASNLPSNVILEEIPMYEDRLTDGYLWQEFEFSNARGLSPSRGLCLAIACLRDDADICDIQYDGEPEGDEDEGGGGAISGGLLRTWDGGASWSRSSERCLLFSVYGTYTTTSTPDPVTRTWVRGVNLRLQAGPDPHTAVETAVRLLNAPEVTE